MATQDEVQAHLRGASDAILLLTDEVRQLEGHKRGIQPADPRFEELATAVRRAAETLAQFTRDEESWSEVTANDGKPAEEMETIARSKTRPALASILERWRSIERRLNEAEPGSREAAELVEQFERVREEYLAAFDSREPEDGSRSLTP